ncbi:ABC transporter permease [Haloplanus aerogenes]|uniref:ABC transporter permease n=1 Tax=Haloplanus aerogenes TaxID=660522 RepID=A0A3M0CSE5_9EURY|nr:ABC transporter permease [Haloplanus aerogenes]AZH26862.1 ABC transporter permease [Haloplanus aerogenes]RMB12511.1 peptide/nickel transport system permease protein [Haloplanus aerogenes]
MGIQRYVAKRTLQAVLVIYVVATAVFVAIRSIPGDPARLILGGDADADAIAAVRAELGLDEPIYVQYVRWMSDLATGDFGSSIYTGEPVLGRIAGAAEPTLSIGLVGITIAILIAIPAGIVSATRRDQWEDYVATGVAFLGISMPSFWIGIVLLLTVGTAIPAIPSYGYASISEGVVPWLSHVVLPATAVGLPYAGIITRMTRSSMLEVLSEDYMQTARAKGLPPRLILFKHGLQNALLPVVTIAGILFALLLGGIVAVEMVFGIQGFGRLLIRSIERQDFPIVQGSVIVIAIIFVFMNLFVDLLYMSINPKIKYGGDA